MMNEEELHEMRKSRRKAFQKKEKILRSAIHESLGMLMMIPDEDGEINKVGAFLADALAKEGAVVVPGKMEE